MQIDHATQRAAIDWQSFSIGSAAWVRFNQPNASAVALNRVVGANPSEIFGRLSANGQVFLTNPNGVLFAPGASVEVGALLATSLSITNADFLAGRNVFSNGGGAGSVVNQGTILTPNGYTALFGPQVRNDGLIVARLGSVALAAGDRVSVDMVGDGLISVSVDQGALHASVVNAGTIEADGGRVLLTAIGASNLLNGVINVGGVVRANSLVERDGEILLTTTYLIDAGPNALITNGGSVDLNASHVILTGEGSVTAPGGSVTIGAGFVSLGAVGSIDVTGGSLQLATGSTLLVVEGSGSIVGPGFITIVDPEAQQRALAASSVQPFSALPARDAQTAMTAAAIAEVCANRPSIFSEPIGFVPPMRHQVHGEGIAIPPGVTLP